MSAMAILPFFGHCLSPSPEPKPARFEVGARVVIPGQAVAIRWQNAGRIEWYPLFGGPAQRIAVLGWQEEDDE
jgi:hypothetical protein